MSDPEVHTPHELDPELVSSSLHNEDLAPTPPEARTWTTYNYAALWIGMAHCIPTYMMASGLIQKGMDWKQALFTILLGNLIVLIPMLLNSFPGTRYGLPFPVICRASFGTSGANLPAVLRALVACGWFGIQTWIGGEALHNLLVAAWPAWKGVPGGVGICFTLFWLLNMWIIWKGMNAVRWFEGWAAPAVLVVTLILLVYMVHRANGLGPILAQSSKFTTVGQFLTVLPLFLTAQIAFWATLSLNMPDFTRYARDQKSQMLGQTLGLPPTMTLFSAMGVVITSATVVVYGKARLAAGLPEAISDPIELLAQPEFGHPLVVLISLISIGVATLSVNVAANVVSPAFDFANLWPSKIDFRIGGTITGVIGILMMPWKLLESVESYMFVWLAGYSIVLGPIAGIMICDFWLLRRQHLSVRQLYMKDGMYSYCHGWNRWAVWALVLAALPNLPGFLITWITVEGGKENFVAGLSQSMQGFAHAALGIYEFSWMVGFALGFALYGAFMKLFEREQLTREAHAAMEGA
ncbi:MAG: NCS1 family nucleobase:cation symporter-1 [Candidatus Eremiobacterota bacterium]